MAVLRRCMPRIGTAHVACAVAHLPEGRAAAETLDFERVGRESHVNDCLRELILSAGGANWGNDPDDNLQSLGQYLQEIAALPPFAFEEQMRLAFARMFGQQIAVLERRLEARGRQPAAWARDVRRYIHALQFALTLPDSWVPADLEGSTVERVNTLRSLVGSYGALLGHWAAMREAAERMCEAVAAMPAPPDVQMAEP